MIGSRTFAVALLIAPLVASRAAAQPSRSADAPTPSQSLASDPDVPRWALAVTADPVALLFGAYGVQVEASVGAAHAFFVTPRWTRRHGVYGLGVEVGYHLWPFGQGLQGVYVGPSAAVDVTAAGHARIAARLGLDVGLQYVWDGLVLAAGGGGQWVFAPGDQRASRLRPRVSVGIGFAWM